MGVAGVALMGWHASCLGYSTKSYEVAHAVYSRATLPELLYDAAFPARAMDYGYEEDPVAEIGGGDHVLFVVGAADRRSSSGSIARHTASSRMRPRVSTRRHIVMMIHHSTISRPRAHASALFALLTVAGACSTLTTAAGRGDAAGVERALARGAASGEPNARGWTALHLAARQGHLEVVRVLLRHGADPNVQDNFGCTPLWGIQGPNAPAIAAALIDAGAILDFTCGPSESTPLMFAVLGGNIELVRLLLDRGANPFLRNFHAKTAISLSREPWVAPDIAALFIRRFGEP